MSMFHLIIPMAGAGSRFSDAGWNVPKPLIEIHGRPFFWWSVMPVRKHADVKDITFVILKEHAERFKIDGAIRSYFPDANIISIPEVLPGPVFTCLEGAKNISDDLPLMFNDCDHMFTSSTAFHALNEGFNYDGGLLTFESSLPCFSYVRCDDEGRVTGTVEKQAVSTHAICGAYVFRSAELFRNLAGEYVKDCPYSECFMSGIYNVMCGKNMRVALFQTDYNVDFGTPEQYEKAQSSEHFNDAL